MLTEPDVQALLHDESRGLGNRFALISLVRKRAIALVDGSPPMVQVESRKAVTISLCEIEQGRLRHRRGEAPQISMGEVDEQAAALAKALGVPQGFSISDDRA